MVNPAALVRIHGIAAPASTAANVSTLEKATSRPFIPAGARSCNMALRGMM